MNYQEKYIKYKAKYLELKNTDNQNGGSEKLLFIMFPGNMVLKKHWDIVDQDSKTEKVKRNDFIRRIKELGDIYFYEPKYYNIYHYNGGKGDNEFWYDEDINFTKDDIDVDKVCEKIFDDVKHFNGKLILLGHSMGAYFVYRFAQKYASKCLFGIIIDGMFLTENANVGISETKYKNNLKKYTRYTDDHIQKLIKNVKKGDKKSIEELSNVYFFNIAKYAKVIKNNMHFSIPMISFYNYVTPYSNKILRKLNENHDSDANYIRKYNDKKNFKIITFLDKTHFPHSVEESKNIILENIKNMIIKYNK